MVVLGKIHIAKTLLMLLYVRKYDIDMYYRVHTCMNQSIQFNPSDPLLVTPSNSKSLL